MSGAGGESGGQRLFVYGTLRRGGEEGGMLSGCRWLGEARVAGVLHDLGAYPALVLGGSGKVKGELWLCRPETLRMLDAYEGLGEGLFERVRVRLAGGPCWVYQAGPALRPHLGDRTLIPGGVWRGPGRAGPGRG